jgi:iron-sulfur cluster repair protein YtfE (RIC family)
MARTQKSGEPNVIDMLIEDHKRVQKLFKDFEKADRSDAEALREIVETTCMELQIHSMLEEELFYPAIRAELPSDETEERLNRAEVEHEAADELVAKLQELSPDDAMYCAYFAVLGEYVRHHIREEEKSLFPQAAKAEGLDLQQLGEAMRQRREELFAEIESDEDEEDAEDLDEIEDEIGAADIADAGVEDEASEEEQQPLDPRRTRH